MPATGATAVITRAGLFVYHCDTRERCCALRVRRERLAWASRGMSQHSDEQL